MREKEIYLTLGGLSVIGLGYYWYTTTKKPQTEVVENPPGTTPTTPTPVVTLDYNKLLKKGVSGNEVKELQKRLGSITADGIFGSNTENRLKVVKGVTQITLNQYNAVPTITTPTNNATALPNGTNVISMNRAGTPITIASVRDDGYFYDTGNYFTTVPYGSKIGTIVSKVPSGTFYVVKYTPADVAKM